jgi:hypothetical protein
VADHMSVFCAQSVGLLDVYLFSLFVSNVDLLDMGFNLQ